MMIIVLGLRGSRPERKPNQGRKRSVVRVPPVAIPPSMGGDMLGIGNSCIQKETLQVIAR